MATIKTITLSKSDRYIGLPWYGSDGMYCTDAVAGELVLSQIARKV
jgi:hypothetical protein